MYVRCLWTERTTAQLEIWPIWRYCLKSRARAHRIKRPQVKSPKLSCPTSGAPQTSIWRVTG
eukprot:9503677-Pyramimonas_sp.AAC.1